jgi:hypothetical protein
MRQMTLRRSSRLWTFQLLGFEMFEIRLQKRHFSTEIHKGPIFDRLKINLYNWRLL